MMVSFYAPTRERFKIIMERDAFPSDRYAVESQIDFHYYDPEEALILLEPREGEVALRDEDIMKAIDQHGDSVALVLIGGVNYYTGQLYDMRNITAAAHKKGCKVGFDLAHAIGNVPLALHEWDVDFACWCSYKYLNSGPGSIGGFFVHERYADDYTLMRFAGWWGHDKKNRFKMGPKFSPMSGAEGWQLSNPPILSLAAVKASLAIFDQAGIPALREKSIKLTGYLEQLLNLWAGEGVRIITPSDPKKRGCQLSLVVERKGKDVFELLQKQGFVCDWREPDCIRVAPVPLYNSYSDVFKFAQTFTKMTGGK
jgi:kynureninase